MRQYKDEYFKNRAQISRIKIAVNTAMPEGVCFYNLITAMQELTAEYTAMYFKDDINNSDPDEKEEESEGDE